MESKYFCNGFVRKSTNNKRPKHIIFNGPVPQKITKIESKYQTLPGKLSPAKTKNLLEQRQALPVYNAKQRLVSLIEKHETLIVIGETGCGKTTQIPQFIFEERLYGSKMIGITQPRRVAATTLSNRVAQEMGTVIGETVGYAIRFEDVTSSETKVKFLTDGMLLRETILDELLLQYSVIILDEAHERTIHTDVLFGIIKKAQKIRNEKCLPNLKIIVMSATMDVDHFSLYFGDVPVVYLEGRQFQVEVMHSVEPQEDYIFSCLVTVFQIHQEAPPNEDILVFLTGQEEIESFAMKIKAIAKDLENMTPPLRVLPLYSSLPATQMAQAFRPTPHGLRKIVISTNVAETSVTIPGIKYVVDSGKVKIKTFNPTTGLDALRVQSISQAQAWQRTGRAGRDSAGHCYRVYTKEEFEKFDKNSKPEIQRCNLTSVSLQLLTLGVNVVNFNFMDKPPKESLKAALVELKILGAINTTENPQLTSLGKQMSQFPIDPRYGKILLSASEFGCVDEIISIIALLSGESVLVHPTSKRDEAREAQKKFVSSCGDHLTLLNVFRNFRKVPQQEQWCHENFLHMRNLNYAMNVRKQLLEICRRNEIAITSCNQEFDRVRKCLISGLFMNVAELQLDKRYLLVTNRQTVSIHPTSVLSNTFPHCVLFSEIIHTNKCYIRQLTVIDPDWLMEMMPDYFRQHRLSTTELRIKTEPNQTYEFKTLSDDDKDDDEEEEDEDESPDEDSPISDDDEENKQVPKWDSFKDPLRENESISMADNSLFDALIQLFKIFAYLLTFCVVLLGAVFAKSILLLMTSQLTPNRTVTVKTGSMFLALRLPDVERYLWVWALLISFSVPEVGVLIRSVRVAIFKGYVNDDDNFGAYPRKSPVSLRSVFMVTVLMEALHVVGLAIFVFEILPHMDVAKGVMLTNCMCFVPALLNVASNVHRSNKIGTLADFLALLGQTSGLFAWPALTAGQINNLWLLTVSLALLSCGWWMNYVSEESPLGFIRFLAQIKDLLKERHIILYRLYLGISVGKIIIFFGSALLILMMQGMDIVDFFQKTREAFSDREIFAHEIDMMERTFTGTTFSVRSIGPKIWWMIGAQATAAYICYIFGKFACRVMIQPFSFAFPCALVVPVTLVLIVVTTALRNQSQSVFNSFLPAYLFFNSPQIYGAFEFFVNENGWIWILWVVSQVWITLHIWMPRCERLSKTETLFATPMYSGFLIDQSITTNRRRDEVEIREKPFKGVSPHIIACATMWHETRPEMLEMLKSLLRMDNDQCLKLSAKNNVRGPEAESNFYTFESHIFFDDAFELENEESNRTVINRFVRDFLKTVKKATKAVYGTEGVRIKPPLKYSTPYGGRLEYTLPGDNKLFVHLKDKDKIRHKKRWSQVMYMYYLLGFKLMELPISHERILEKAENTYLLALDGDIDFKPDAVLLLVDLMKKNKNLGAACGRIHPVGSGFMVWYQLFEYAIGHWLQKATEHMIGCVLCSPGCFSLFRAKALMSPNVMKRYTTKAEEARHYVQYDQGEDRWLCTLLLQRGYRVEYSAASDAYTHCPETFNEFYTQRRRWIPSTVANIVDLLNDYKKTVRVNNDISLLYIAYQMLLLIGTVLGPGTILLMLVGAFNAAFKIDNYTAFYYNLIPIAVFILCCLFTSGKFQLSAALVISLMYGLIMMAVLVGIVMEVTDDGLLSPSSMFLFITAGEIIIAGILHPQEIFCLFCGVVYYVTIPSMYLLLIIYSVCNLNVVSWGTRETAKKKTKADLENEKKEAEKKAQRTKLFGILDAFSGNQKTEHSGALEFSLSNFFRCMCCTTEKSNPANEQFVKIGETLNVLKNKLDNIERNMEAPNAAEFKLSTPKKSVNPNETGKTLTDDDSVLVQGVEDTDDDDLRDELFNPYWIEDRDLKNSKFEVLSSVEITFWKDLIKNYLAPLVEDKEKQKEVKKNLKELRDKMIVTFFMLNALFVIVVFLLQVNKDQIHIQWPLEAKANITFNPVTYEITIQKTYLQLEPVGLAFISFFASVLVIQFVAMLFHRFETLCHLLSNTPLTALQGKKAMSFREKLEFAKKQFNIRNQEDDNDDIKKTPHPETSFENIYENRKSRVINLDQMYSNILKEMKETEEKEEAVKMERRRSSLLPWKRNSLKEHGLSKGSSFINPTLNRIEEEH